MKRCSSVCVCALGLSALMFATDGHSQTTAADEVIFHRSWNAETADTSELGQTILQLHSSVVTGAKTKDSAERELLIRGALATVKSTASGGFYNRVTCAGNVCEAVTIFPEDMVSSADDFRAISKSITDPVNSLESGDPRNPMIVVNVPNERKAFGIARYIKY